MADLTIPSSGDLVIAGTGARIASGVLGAAGMLAGQPIYKDSADDNKLKPCDANDSAMAVAVGILLTGGGDEQPCSYITQGNCVLGAGVAMTAGERYYVSPDAGGIQPSADLASLDYVTLLGIADSTTNLVVSLLASGVVIP